LIEIWAANFSWSFSQMKGEESPKISTTSPFPIKGDFCQLYGIPNLYHLVWSLSYLLKYPFQWRGLTKWIRYCRCYLFNSHLSGKIPNPYMKPWSKLRRSTIVTLVQLSSSLLINSLIPSRVSLKYMMKYN
jgi:hypothetical protein